MDRPVTSKSRGLCRYYKEPRGCFAGDKCKFMHAEAGEATPLTPYDQAKTCHFYAQGFCKRGDKCWFKHSRPKASNSTAIAVDEGEPEYCSICFDYPSTYGLLMGCTHVFCITCIKEWRESAKKNNEGGIQRVTKLCPMCRAPSKYITPSSVFYKHGDSRKDNVVNAYKDSMARLPCRYFQRSKNDASKKPFCPFGKDCFYQHLSSDGTPYIFQDGVDVCMRRHPNASNRTPSPAFEFRPFNYPNPLEMIEVFMSDHLGDIAARISRNVLERDNDFPPQERPDSLFFHRLFTSTRPQPPRQDNDLSDMPPLERIDRSPSRNSYDSEQSMPPLQDVSESDSDEEDPYFSNNEDNDVGGDSNVSGHDDMPPLEPIARPMSWNPDRPLAPAGHSPLQALDDAPIPEDTSREETSRPPFVTDGRGRVIGASGAGSDSGQRDDLSRSIFGRVFGAFL